jgi:transcriptional regulator with XRE-family HTH domain
MKTDTLLDRLTQTAKAAGLASDRAIARRIGITSPELTHLRVGRRSPGVKVLAGIRQAFPELKPAVDEYLDTYEVK